METPFDEPMAEDSPGQMLSGRKTGEISGVATPAKPEKDKSQNVGENLTYEGETDPTETPVRKVIRIKSITKQRDLEPRRSVEGWIIIVTNLHEEVSEEDVADLFNEFGEVQNVHLNLDRQTGYVKGYALVEYQKFEEADRARRETDGMEFLDRKLSADFAFVMPTKGSEKGRGDGRRTQSRSPER